ncbi:MAG: hypothetical protein ACKVY0_01135 [Prosthecobacter sp.]|uniref:hypothetical protein n=1 Tax=Prosthecobacter sp. TaxID=1965333 RepID=UPI0039043863
MSTASEGIPTDHATHAGQPPGALAMLAATALGGVIVSRMNKTPLILAAGAAALALLNRKKVSTPKAAPPCAPEPVQAQPKIQPQSQIEQWLTQQIHREENAPFIELPPAAASIEPEDDYIPQSLLSDDAAEITVAPPPHDAFASLTEPVFRMPKAAPMRFEPKPALSVLQALEATESCPTLDAAWILGVEPLPSLNESAASPSLVSRMFSTQPVPMTNLAAPAVFSAPVFEGGTLPDEIEVTPSTEPVIHLTPMLPQALTTAPEAELVRDTAPAAEVPEILVQIAAPGEASFDPPLAIVPNNPWMPPVEAPPPSQPSPLSPVFEAEIVLRPRAPTQVAVVAKTRPVSSRFAKTAVPAAAPADREDPVQVNATVQTPHEQPANTTWRSWWRGD